MQNNDYTVAIIEDDLMQLENLETAITAQGFKVMSFSDRPSAEQAFAKQWPDLVISDIILGREMDGGFDLAKNILTYNRPIPIIFLSERQSEFDIYTGHALGAIDYLPKPISLNVLIAKVKNLLRITGSHYDANETKSKINHLKLADDQFKAYWHDAPLYLTATEYEMLKQFAILGEKGVATYDVLQESTQGVVERNTINTHICRIRNAFKKVDPNFNQIHNEYGKGYSWQSKA